MTSLVACDVTKVSEERSDDINITTDNNTTITTEPVTTEPITNDPITTSPITTEPITSEPITSEKDDSTSIAIEHDWTINSYYKKDIDLTLSGASLKTNLYQIINEHHQIGYANLYNAYLSTDLRDDGTIWDMYSSQHYSPSQHTGNYSKEGDMYNREHTIPQSIFNEQEPLKSDIFHVYPTDGYINNIRSNYPHAEVGSITNTCKGCNPSSNGSKMGPSKTTGVSGNVFEPIDEYKGDFARTYFYFVTCYQNKMSSFKDYAVFSKNSYPSLSKWAIDLYKKWSSDDPVSEKEIERNEAAYKIQKNRNPFIDFPGIEDLIW